MIKFRNRRLQSKVHVYKDRFINSKQITKFFLPILIVILIMPVAMYVTIYAGYHSKLITSESTIPEEQNVMVVIANDNFEDIIYLIRESEKIYTTRKFSNIYLFVRNASEDINIDEIKKQNKSIPADKFQIDVEEDTIINICSKTKDKYKLSKFVILANEDSLIRSTFICNDMNLYTVGLNLTNVNENTSQNVESFFDRINEIFTVVFSN